MSEWPIISFAKKLEEIRNKLSTIKNINHRKPLLLQIEDHKKALQLIELLKELDIKIQNIKRSFDRMIFTAMQRIGQQNPAQANELLGQSKRHLASLKAQIESQKRIEKGLIDINKKTIKDLKREKEALNR
jgi:prephenate dehydrogenase